MALQFYLCYLYTVLEVYRTLHLVTGAPSMATGGETLAIPGNAVAGLPRPSMRMSSQDGQGYWGDVPETVRVAPTQD